MPEKTTTENLILLYALGAGVAGVIAQIGSAYALKIASDRRQFLGFLILSLVFSIGVTVIAHDVFHLSERLSAVAGALVGTVPSAITLRIGLKKALERAGVEMDADDKTLMKGGKNE